MNVKHVLSESHSCGNLTAAFKIAWSAFRTGDAPDCSADLKIRLLYIFLKRLKLFKMQVQYIPTTYADGVEKGSLIF